MIAQTTRRLFDSRFNFLQQCAPDFVDNFYQQASFIELPAGAPICEEGQYCSHLAMVLQGTGRVYKLSPGGREITLYRINAGESCVLTASCIMSEDRFPAMAESETAVQAVLVSPLQVKRWLCQDSGWQKFIFGLLSHRLAEIVSVVEEVAFKRIDVRLAEQLHRGLLRSGAKLSITHAELAADVGSSREVISRILKDFSDRGLVTLGRGQIEILDAPELARLSRQ